MSTNNKTNNTRLRFGPQDPSPGSNTIETFAQSSEVVVHVVAV